MALQHIKFFTPAEEAILVEAIRQAESGTTGEIRVHLEIGAKHDPLTKAETVFRRLGMDQTADRNGVLILLEINRQEFAILGDQGITSKVSADFWQEERDLLQDHFRRREFVAGLVLAIEQVGAKLKRFFPHSGEDRNELPNEISYS